MDNKFFFNNLVCMRGLNYSAQEIYIIRVNECTIVNQLYK